LTGVQESDTSTTHVDRHSDIDHSHRAFYRLTLILGQLHKFQLCFQATGASIWVPGHVGANQSFLHFAMQKAVASNPWSAKPKVSR